MGKEPTFWQAVEHPSQKICCPERNHAPLERSSSHIGPPQTQAPWNVVFQFIFLKIRKCLTICCLPADLQLGQNALSIALPGTNCSEIHEMHSFSAGGY